MHRLFVAIRPPEAVRDTLIDAMEGIDGVRWVDDANLHLTLRFVGEVERPMANDLAAALGQIEWPGFELEIEGIGHFTRKGEVTALWARVPASEALEGLRQKVEGACEAVGLARETRRFTPHITLARIDRAAGPIGGWLGTFGDLRAGPWEVRDFVLYESHLGHTGAFYEPARRYDLRN